MIGLLAVVIAISLVGIVAHVRAKRKMLFSNASRMLSEGDDERAYNLLIQALTVAPVPRKRESAKAALEIARFNKQIFDRALKTQHASTLEPELLRGAAACERIVIWLEQPIDLAGVDAQEWNMLFSDILRPKVMLGRKS